MKVTVLKGILPNRDADFEDLSDDFFHEKELSNYLESTRLKIKRQTGTYRSTQGATITPVPCWPVDFQTGRRKTGSEYLTFPKRLNNQYHIQTADWATEVSGTGTEKEKWRGISLEGPCSTSHLYSVVTSTYLVPFALGYRYLAHLPAEMDEDDDNAELKMRHDFTQYENSSLDDWDEGTNIEIDVGEQAIKEWTIKAQKLWEEKKTPKSPDRVTDRLDYHDTLSSQKPKSPRVVHTRSRSFYAAVLNPLEETALRVPYSSAKLYTRENGQIIDTEYLPVEGVICDNKLHTIEVDTEEEAYWMMGLFNSDQFNSMVMKEAEGEPPGIYSLPAKILNNNDIEFDPSDDIHIELADLAMVIEEKMKETIRKYIKNEKNVNIAETDDTDESPEIPTMVSSAHMRRLDADDELEELNKRVNRIIDS